jgi:hypothetical protein
MKYFNSIVFIAAISFLTPAFGQQTNLALHKPVTATSEDKQYPASNAVDGVINRRSKWMTSTSKAPHILEVDLQKYCNINEVDVYTGIPEAERTSAETTQAAGFWSAKNFKIQYWDDANWTDFPNAEVLENRLVAVKFKFNPVITTYKIRFVCDDGEPISVMEIEALGTEAPNMPVPPQITSNIKALVNTGNKDATVTVSPEVVGKSLKFVGYNQGYYFPGSNVSGWLEYSNINSLRVWATMNAFVPESAVQVDNSLKDVDQFDRLKNELRLNPEKNRFIQWDKLYPLYTKMDSSSTNAMVFNYTLSELKRLHIQAVLQMNTNEFNDTWGNKWEQWQRFYALAYYAAKMGDVTMFAMQNEPNHVASGPMKLNQWIGGMQIVSDAVHCAVEDVDKKYAKNLQAKFVGPVTAGQNTDWWAGVTKAIRTDYHGKQIDHDLIDIFDVHSYNSPAAGYVSRVNNIRKLITDNHPAGKALPIVFTEIGRWMNAYLIDKEETMDSPSLFTEWAGMYANNMKNNAYGMWAFKFANTTSSTYPEGIKSGHHLTWHGKRIVEDAYTDLALGKFVKASFASAKWPSKNITDGDKSDQSSWRSDSASTEKWLEIDLGKTQKLGSAVIYTGSSAGVFTGVDRVKQFKLQYWDANAWKDIPGTAEKNCKYVQVFQEFKKPVTTDKIRWVSTDAGIVKVREIKLFGADDGPSSKPDFNISGIQRTGEVVRLFAKGFKNEVPLLKTQSSIIDDGLDTYTSYDKEKDTYYMWLVQRGMFDYHLNINLANLPITPGTPIIAETVGPDSYGEVTGVYQASANKKVTINLNAQSVILLTIPAHANSKQAIRPVANAFVAGGTDKAKNFGTAKTLQVALNASKPENNRVTYIDFKVPEAKISDAKRIILSVNGKVDKGTAPFRLHVYGIPGKAWEQQKLTWANAPLLDSKEALINGVGQLAFIAGELAFDNKNRYHSLDVTEMIKKHVKDHVTFVFVRETRQLGDDSDKGRQVLIGSMEGVNKPVLNVWSNHTK